jgi:hypothetical protein
MPLKILCHQEKINFKKAGQLKLTVSQTVRRSYSHENQIKVRLAIDVFEK